MELLLDVHEERANFLLELLQQFDFVSIKNKKDENPYNPEFVAKMLEGKKDRLEGKTTRVNIDDFWK